MGSWALIFLAVWFLGTCAGTAFAILLVRAGSTSLTPAPEAASSSGRQQAA